MPSPSATPSGNAGGSITIPIPTPAAILCSPQSLTIAVNQRVVITCSVQNFDGALAITNGDPAIADVEQATGTTTLFYVSGLAAGSATISLQSPQLNTGSFIVTVTP